MDLECISLGPEGGSTGPPILFVHGSYHAAWCWREYWMPYFAERGFVTHALSLRGHGGSGGTYKGARLADYLGDVRAVMSGFERPPILIGHSLGGYIVQHLLMDDAVPAAVLVATMPSDGPPRHLFWRTLRRHPLRFMRAAATRNMWPLVATPELCREQFFSARLPRTDLVSYAHRMQGESMAVQLDLLSHKPGVPARAPPMLVLAAEHDDFDTTTQQATADRYGADCLIVSGSGHDVMLDVQWRIAADLVIDWLASRVASLPA